MFLSIIFNYTETAEKARKNLNIKHPSDFPSPQSSPSAGRGGETESFNMEEYRIKKFKTTIFEKTRYQILCSDKLLRGKEGKKSIPF
jgi:hypothetical protein